MYRLTVLNNYIVRLQRKLTRYWR